MRTMKTAAAALALCAAIGVPAAGASKPKHPGNNNTPPVSHPAPKGQVTYIFRGVVAATPVAPTAATSTTAPGTNGSVQVQVNAGNKAAVLKLGAAADTFFTVPLAPATQVMSWSAENKPVAATAASLQVGDPVALTIMGAKDATLAQLLATAPTRIDDYLLSTKPHGRLFLFQGTTAAIDMVNHTITVNIVKTNWRAGYALRGASMTETFKWDPAKTTFVDFHGAKPHLFGAANVKVGDSVTVKIISANYDSALSTLLGDSAWRINDHEPMALVNKAIAGSNTHVL
jgi:hypothetical protein